MNVTHEELAVIVKALGGQKKVTMRMQVGLAYMRFRVKEGLVTGTKDDYLYEQAQTVSFNTVLRDPKRGQTTYVDITHEGVLYEKVAVGWGPLDADQLKSTVLVKRPDGKWIKLWFWDKDIRAK